MNRLVAGGVTLAIIFYAVKVQAHTSEQGFVLLLPTNVYIGAGVMAVALSVLILAVLPARSSTGILDSKALFRTPDIPSIKVITSLTSFTCLIILLVIGFIGPHDPLKNLLPLSIWTIWWIGFVCLHGVLGNLWHWVNPWAGIYQLLRATNKPRQPLLNLPVSVGVWPAVFLYIAFSCFALADPAPEDPLRLTIVVSAYWTFTLIGMLVFGGSVWLQRCECFTVLLNRMAQLSVVSSNKKQVFIGLPGWQLFTNSVSSTSAAVFILTLLAIGSFDGLNETFYWLGILGINPLEFPGRSAVILQTVSGLLLSIVLLIACFALCVYSGCALANHRLTDTVSFSESFVQLSASILPIALAYHFAHYLTAFLVNSQYALSAATDPLLNGSDLLGLGKFYVTTGFLNTSDTVKVIWLTQAAAVVVGHVLSVILAHSIAIRLWQDSRRAILSQLPLALFMILYTMLGLWLLAAPRGA
ncbi:MAG: hypothetical protein V3U65_15225 [Granulosicoccaceae bacterium]